MTSSAIHRQWNFDAPVVSLAVNRNGDWAAASLGDGSLRLIDLAAEVEADKTKPLKEMKLHDGVSLSLQPDADAHAFLSGGDDGKIFIVDPKLDAPTLLTEHKNQWIDHVAGAPKEGFRAYSVGKQVFVFNEEGEKTEQPLVHASSVGGLAFSPNGKRLAASHYNGVSLWWTNTINKSPTPVSLPWKSSHLGVIWHPDGKTVLTSLQENALHGWRLSDMNEMRMQGYAAKIHSFDFTPKGKYLATSGAEQVICWPFFGGGPWGKTPLTLGGRDARLVTRVAAHPKDELVAAGFDDGMIMLAPLDGRMEAMIHGPLSARDHSATAPEGAGATVTTRGAKNAAVTGLVWSADGDCLVAALENGYLMMFTVESVRKFVSHV